jgi:hypothetical protein
MECEVVQKELASGAIASELREGVNTHLTSCIECRRSALLYSGINEALRNEQVWHPPAGFALRVASVAAPIFVVSRKRNRFGTAGAIAATLVFLAGYLFAKGRLVSVLGEAFGDYVGLVSFGSRILVTNAVSLAWIFAATSIFVTGRFVRRSLRAEEDS